MTRKRCIVIAGPTASGKTPLAIELARHFSTEIISADSRQCYRELQIGVAKPSDTELRQVKHHFIDTHSIHDDVNAAVFGKYALDACDKIFQTANTAVLVGGTGMYVKAFCEGLDEMPAIPAGIRESIQQQYKKSGIEWLQKEVQQKDPLFYSLGETANPQRLMRALEIKTATGKSVKEFQKGIKAQRSFDITKIGIHLPPNLLHQNIDQRVDVMIQQGLVDEVKSLIGYRYLNALQTVGYTELFDFLDGRQSLPATIALIKQNTRQYAKRQLTWFRKDKSIHWITRPSLVDLLRCVS